MLGKLTSNTLGLSILLYTDYTRAIKIKSEPIIYLNLEFEKVLKLLKENKKGSLRSLALFLKVVYKLLADSEEGK